MRGAVWAGEMGETGEAFCCAAGPGTSSSWSLECMKYAEAGMEELAYAVVGTVNSGSVPAT
jgi:hypothetical protein